MTGSGGEGDVDDDDFDDDVDDGEESVEAAGPGGTDFNAGGAGTDQRDFLCQLSG